MALVILFYLYDSLDVLVPVARADAKRQRLVADVNA